MTRLLLLVVVACAISACATPYGTLSGTCIDSQHTYKAEGQAPQTITISGRHCTSPGR